MGVGHRSGAVADGTGRTTLRAVREEIGARWTVLAIGDRWATYDRSARIRSITTATPSSLLATVRPDAAAITSGWALPIA